MNKLEDDRGYLTDDAISDYIDIICKTYNKTDSDKVFCSYSYFVTAFHSKLRYRNNTEIDQYCKSIKSRDKPKRDIKIEELFKWIIPIHIGSNHWALIIVSVQTGHICIYDSLYDFDGTNTINSFHLQSAYLVVAFIKRYGKLNNIKRLYEQVWNIAPYNLKLKQTDGYNCGVYVLTLIEMNYIYPKDLMFNISIFDIEVERNNVIQSIIQEKMILLFDQRNIKFDYDNLYLINKSHQEINMLRDSSDSEGEEQDVFNKYWKRLNVMRHLRPTVARRYTVADKQHVDNINKLKYSNIIHTQSFISNIPIYIHTCSGMYQSANVINKLNFNWITHLVSRILGKGISNEFTILNMGMDLMVCESMIKSISKRRPNQRYLVFIDHVKTYNISKSVDILIDNKIDNDMRYTSDDYIIFDNIYKLKNCVSYGNVDIYSLKEGVKLIGYLKDMTTMKPYDFIILHEKMEGNILSNYSIDLVKKSIASIIIVYDINENEDIKIRFIDSIYIDQGINSLKWIIDNNVLVNVKNYPINAYKYNIDLGFIYYIDVLIPNK